MGQGKLACILVTFPGSPVETYAGAQSRTKEPPHSPRLPRLPSSVPQLCSR